MFNFFFSGSTKRSKLSIMINHCMYWKGSTFFKLRDICSSSLSLVSLSEFKSRKEDGC